VEQNLRTYVLHQITLRINNRSHGRFAAVSGATKRAGARSGRVAENDGATGQAVTGP
jgi:hypothetical protein